MLTCNQARNLIPPKPYVQRRLVQDLNFCLYCQDELQQSSQSDIMQAAESKSLKAYAASRIELERFMWTVVERRRLLNESSAESCPSTLVRLPPMCSGAVPEADVRRRTSLGVCIMLPGRTVGATGRSSSCETDTLHGERVLPRCYHRTSKCGQVHASRALHVAAGGMGVICKSVRESLAQSSVLEVERDRVFLNHVFVYHSFLVLGSPPNCPGIS